MKAQKSSFKWEIVELWTVKPLVAHKSKVRMKFSDPCVHRPVNFGLKSRNCYMAFNAFGAILAYK